MLTEFRKAVLPDEVRSLVAFDRKVFGPSDRFYPSNWLDYECWWLIVNRIKVGCCAFQADTDLQDDVKQSAPNPAKKHSLYIASTGIHPKYQGKGLGALLKSWQIAYARHHGYKRIVTNTRLQNQAILALNKKFGFKEVRVTPGYYVDPDDATVVLELLLPSLQDGERQIIRRNK